MRACVYFFTSPHSALAFVNARAWKLCPQLDLAGALHAEKKSIGMCIICLMALGKKAKKLKRPCNFIPGPNNGTSLFSDAAVKIFSPFTERARRDCGEARIATFLYMQTQTRRRFEAGETRIQLCVFSPCISSALRQMF